MKKALLSLVICGLSVGGTSYGQKASSLEKMHAFESNMVEMVESANEKMGAFKNNMLELASRAGVDVSKAEVVDGSKIKGFSEDLMKVRNKTMSGAELANKYGTEEGKVYKVGNICAFLEKQKEDDGNFCRYFFFSEDPIEDLKELDKQVKTAEESLVDFESIEKKEVPIMDKRSKALREDFSPVFEGIVPAISQSRKALEGRLFQQDLFSRGLDSVSITARDSLFFGLYTVYRAFLDTLARNLADSLLSISYKGANLVLDGFKSRLGF